MKPKVEIDNEVYRKIMHWVNKSQYEVSGLGNVVFDRDKMTFRVVSAMLLPQKNGSTHTDIEPEHVCKAMFDLRESEGEMKFWWHSHVDMAVFWSGTDMETIKSIGQGGWVVSSVFNKKREVKSSFYSTDAMFPVFLDDLDTKIDTFQDAKTAEWDAEYTANVQIAPPTPKYNPATMWDSRTDGWVKNQGYWTRPTPIIGGHPVLGMNSPATTKPSEEACIIAYKQNRKPIGLSKREWKAWKKQHKNELEAHYTDSDKAGDAENEYVVDESLFVKPYPFTQEELNWLATEGIDTAELDWMLSESYSRNEILQLVEEDHTLEYPEDLDDIPVADRRRFAQ